MRLNYSTVNRVLGISIALALLVTGCNNSTPITPTPGKTLQPEQSNSNNITDSSISNTKNSKKTQKTYEINFTGKDAYKADVKQFDIGGGEYQTPYGSIMPYEIRGVIGVPEGEGKFPLILITHGSHSNEDESQRFDTGFTYLVEKLAKNGYIAVSMDMSKAYIWKYGDSDDKEKSMYLANKHIEHLIEADKGNNLDYPVELKNKIDFSNIAFIGHSRGGDTIFNIGLEQQKKGVKVKALLSLAPAISSDINTREWPDTMVSILVPEYDGDVVSLDGFMIYDRLNKKSSQFHSITLLNKANHNYFNSNLQQNDAVVSRREEQLTDQISAEQQQQFFSNFAVDFFNASLKGETEGTAYTFHTSQPNKMYGLDVMNKLSSANRILVADIMKYDEYMDEEADIDFTQDSWFYEKDNIIIDTLTFGQEENQVRPLLEITWEEVEEERYISLIPETQDFSTSDSLTIQMVIDSASKLNEDGKSQNFTIILKDTIGNVASVTLPERLNALRKIPGKIDITQIEEEDFKFWSVPTPISEIRIPLTEFEGIDLAKIQSLSFSFDQNTSGAIYLESVYIQ